MGTVLPTTGGTMRAAWELQGHLRAEVAGVCEPRGADLTEGQGEAGWLCHSSPSGSMNDPRPKPPGRREDQHGQMQQPPLATRGHWLPAWTCSVSVTVTFFQSGAAPRVLAGLWKPHGRELSAG